MKTLFDSTMSTPAGQSPRPLYAHGAAIRYRQFLYEQDPGAVMRIRLGVPPPPHVRGVLEAAVEHINALHYSFASRQGKEEIAPDVRAAELAIVALYAIQPPIPAQIFPLPGGGLQMEWHHGNLDVEIECPADGPYYFYLGRGAETAVDEEASGHRAIELFEQVGATLADALGRSGENLVLGRPL